MTDHTPTPESDYVLVDREHLKCLAGLHGKHVHKVGGADRVKWEGVWHEGPLATAFIRLVKEVSDAANIMLAAARPTPADQISPATRRMEQILGMPFVKRVEVAAKNILAAAEATKPRTTEARLRELVAEALPAVWTDFLDANPDDLTSPEDLPDHALMTGKQFEEWALEAFARAALEAERGS